MAAVTTLNIEFEFKGGGKKRLTIGEFHPTDDAVSSFKSKVMAWNTAFNTNKPAWYDLIIDNDGTNLIESSSDTTNAPIVRAFYETTQTTDIPLS